MRTVMQVASETNVPSPYTASGRIPASHPSLRTPFGGRQEHLREVQHFDRLVKRGTVGTGCDATSGDETVCFIADDPGAWVYHWRVCARFPPDCQQGLTCGMTTINTISEPARESISLAVRSCGCPRPAC